LHLDVPRGADFELDVWGGDESFVAEGDGGATGEPEDIDVELGPTPGIYYITVEPYLDNVSSEPYVLSADW
jgi:hypothetical protein